MHNMTEKARRNKFLGELGEFLELTIPLEAVAHSEGKKELDFPGKIDICHNDWDDLRAKLHSRGKTARIWIQQQFLGSSDVVVGNNLPHFKQILGAYRADPCVTS